MVLSFIAYPNCIHTQRTKRTNFAREPCELFSCSQTPNSYVFRENRCIQTASQPLEIMCSAPSRASLSKHSFLLGGCSFVSLVWSLFFTTGFGRTPYKFQVRATVSRDACRMIVRGRTTEESDSRSLALDQQAALSLSLTPPSSTDSHGRHDQRQRGVQVLTAAHPRHRRSCAGRWRSC